MDTHFPTESIRTDNRDFWSEVICQKLLEGNCEFPRDRAFCGYISASRPAEISFSRVSSIGGKFMRSETDARRAPGEFFILMIQLHGTALVSQDGREVLLSDPDTFTCADGTRALTLDFPDEFDHLALYVPRGLIEDTFGPTERLTTRLFTTDSPLLSVVSPFLWQTATVLEHVPITVAKRLSDIALSLVMTTLGEISAKPTDSRTALLYRAQVFIETHARDHTLNPGTVAAALRISTRYLQELFRADSSTPSEYIWTNRLRRCAEDLSDLSLDALNISEIALRGGFQDFAHFSRRFKAAHGMSPREFRQERKMIATLSAH